MTGKTSVAHSASSYTAEGVEDRRGKGNGLDAWRRVPEGIEGFQARRFDGRFGAKQAAKLEDNVVLAVERCETEFKNKLTRYVLLTNIDLEPGHGGVEGEIERFSKLRNKLEQDHHVKLDVHGLTWVHTRLLENPKLRPELFEDIAEQLREIEQRWAARLEPTTLAQQRALETAERLSKALATLLREGRLHHERGVVHREAEELSLAARSFRDALRLIADLEVDIVFQGQVELRGIASKLAVRCRERA